MWKTVGVSVKGTGHIRAGLPCQDAHQVSVLPGERLVAAVGDGAGSASRSEEGAMLAVSAAHIWLNSLPKNLSEMSEEKLRETLTAPLNHALGALERQAEAEELPLREFATTLLIAFATPDYVAAAQIGDGAIVLRDANGDLHALTTPQNGEHANETTFLVSAGALETAQVYLWRGEVTHLALFTDGLQHLALKLPEAIPHAPFFTPLLQFVSKADEIGEVEAQSQLENFLRSPRITDRTDDDLTLVLASLTR
ncbi:MAG: protein phosphatase 2C domain-containing protein [Chthonomonadaceae bacterium]|nr:protein phosphatase 2C domain-containing protein [Chthonomonadaceae bacterium]